VRPKSAAREWSCLPVVERVIVARVVVVSSVSRRSGSVGVMVMVLQLHL